MTAPRDPSAPIPVLSMDADPSATARMPVPEDPVPPGATPPGATPPGAPPATPAWTQPAPGPAWHPVRRADDGRGPSIVLGLVLLAVGLWFFAEHTLGLDLPTVRWSQLWPIILIVLGVWVLFGARRRSP